MNIFFDPTLSATSAQNLSAAPSNGKRLLLAGAGGFVGRALAEYMTAKGWEVVPLSRTKKEGTVFWDPQNDILSPSDVSGFDAAVSLAGENIFRTWSPFAKKEILESRIKTAQLLGLAMSLAKNPPKVFLCASAVGYYGTSQQGENDENAPAGKGFLAEVCRKWENAARIAESDVTRVVNARFGIVLGSGGGILSQYEKFLRFRISPIFGDGSQNMPWISMRDLCGAINFAVENPSLHGAANFVSTSPCTNGGFAKVCAQSVGGALKLRIPKFALRLAFGEAADELMLSNISAPPKKLLACGFQFLDGDVFTVVSQAIKTDAENSGKVRAK